MYICMNQLLMSSILLLVTSLHPIQIQTVMIKTFKANYYNEGVALIIIKDTLHMLAAHDGIFYQVQPHYMYIQYHSSATCMSAEI